jgi:hypothetical protein
MNFICIRRDGSNDKLALGAWPVTLLSEAFVFYILLGILELKITITFRRITYFFTPIIVKETIQHLISLSKKIKKIIFVLLSIDIAVSNSCEYYKSAYKYSKSGICLLKRCSCIWNFNLTAYKYCFHKNNPQ